MQNVFLNPSNTCWNGREKNSLKYETIYYFMTYFLSYTLCLLLIQSR